VRLRFDRVVLRLDARLREALADSVPAGRTVVWTMTAPIRLPAKTADALEGKIRALLERGAPGGRYAGTIERNRVRVRVLATGAKRTGKVIGFVHNPDVDPAPLFELSDELLAQVRRARSGGPRRA
jgi:hypothetical protein